MRLTKFFIFIYFLTSSLTITTRLNAQEKKIEEQLYWKEKHIELHTLSNETKTQSCIFALGKDSIKAFVVNSKVEVIRKFTMSRHSNEKLLGGFFKGGNIYLFMDNGRKAGLHPWVLNLTTGIATESVIPFDAKERIISRMSSSSHFIYLTINIKTPEFIIYDFSNENSIDTVRYPVDKDVYTTITELNGSAGYKNRRMNVEKADMQGECDIAIAKYPNKTYVNGDTLYLVINKEAGISKIYRFDLNNKQIKLMKIDHGFGEIKNPLMTFANNSFLLDNKLFYAGVTANTLTVEVIDLATGTILKRFQTDHKEEIEYKNTPIYQEGGGSLLTMDDSRELNRTGQLLRKMLKGTVVIIAVRNDSNNIILSIGSYKEKEDYVPLGIPFGLVGDIVAVSVKDLHLHWTKSAHFKMLLDDQTNEHIMGNLVTSINDKIENYTKKENISPGAENLFSNNGKYYYAYYNEDGKLVVVQF